MKKKLIAGTITTVIAAGYLLTNVMANVETPKKYEVQQQETKKDITEPTKQGKVKTDENGRFTEPPEVGSMPGNIVIDPNNYNSNDSKYFQPAYRRSSIGQCAWYAESRFKEVYGIDLPFDMGGVKEWLSNTYKSNELKSILDISDVPEQSIAVFVPETDKSLSGHVSFVEYVESDKYGKPVNIYYTEANGKGDLNKGQFDYGYDGVVIKESYEKFKSPYKLKLAGFIVPSNYENK